MKLFQVWITFKVLNSCNGGGKQDIFSEFPSWKSFLKLLGASTLPSLSTVLFSSDCERVLSTSAIFRLKYCHVWHLGFRLYHLFLRMDHYHLSDIFDTNRKMIILAKADTRMMPFHCSVLEGDCILLPVSFREHYTNEKWFVFMHERFNYVFFLRVVTMKNWSNTLSNTCYKLYINTCLYNKFNLKCHCSYIWFCTPFI